MPTRIRLAPVALCSLLTVFCASAGHAATGNPTQSISPQIKTVLARDAVGRAVRFQDPSGREYRCAYDEQGRAIMIEFRDEQNVARRTLLGYDTNGRLRIAQFPSGYMLFIDYAPNGSRVARDGGGNEVVLSMSEHERVPAGTAEQRQRLQDAAQSTLALADALRAP